MSSGFVTESEAVDIRKKRQEEWERVRNATDPIERPEEPFDGRSLYDRLLEQKQKKDLEYEEAHKLKNMIKYDLDDDEVDFLDLVDRSKLAADLKKSQEDEKELNDYRSRVATLQEEALDQKIGAGVTVNKPKINNQKRSQLTLLQGAVVKKADCPKKRKLDGEPEENEEIKTKEQKTSDSQCSIARPANSGLQCIVYWNLARVRLL